jgi:hypothetical protein
MKKTFFAILLLISINSFAQTPPVPKFIRKMYFETDTTRKSSFVILPALGATPETGLEVGGTALYSFYADTSDRKTRVSNVYLYGSLTTKGQSRLSISTSYWTYHNKYHITGYAGYINFPFDYYGVGNNTLKADADKIDQKRLKLSAGIEQQVVKNLYLGITTGGFKYAFKDKVAGGIFSTTPVDGASGGSTVFLGPTLIYDNRNNITYTTKGFIINTYYQQLQGLFSNNSLKGGFFNIEFSQFFSLGRKLVLGIDAQDQSLFGASSPFYLLPSLGNDEIMRGYYNGRYRDRNLIAAQTELRYRFSDRFGIVGFIGTGEVFHDKFSFNELKPNYGGGFRYFFDIEKGLSIRFDYGIGEKVPGESRQSGFYVALGQAF